MPGHGSKATRSRCRWLSTIRSRTLLRFATQPVDGFDLFLLEGMSRAGITQVLTDDGDYSTVPGLEVFTANPRVLAAARSASLLLVR